MTIKDGFKLGLGLALAQLAIAISLLVLSIPVLYVVGSSVKDKVTQSVIESMVK